MEYEILKSNIIPCYVYYDKEDSEEYWIDLQNCLDNVFQEEDDLLYQGIILRYWIIVPYKPKGITITSENEDLIQWRVMIGPDASDHGKEWNFDKHCVKED